MSQINFSVASLFRSQRKHLKNMTHYVQVEDYSPASGIIDGPEDGKNFKGFVESFDLSEVNDISVKRQDCKLLVLTKDVDRVVSEDDFIDVELKTGLVRFKVKGFYTDPTETVYIFHVRQHKLS